MKIVYGVIDDSFTIGKISDSFKSGVIDEVFKFVTPSGELLGLLNLDGTQLLNLDGTPLFNLE
jgi:hypothetical protein